MIVSMHVASGAAIGAATGSRIAAALLGPPAHLAADWVPHRDIPNRGFELGSGVFCLGLLALRRGMFDPATIGGFAAAAPDLEHVFRVLRPHGRKVFHGRHGWHRSGPFTTSAQLVLAGATIGLLLARNAG